MPEGKNGCSAPASIYVDSASVFGERWQTALGLKVGSSAAAITTLYPRAILRRGDSGGRRGRSYWIVHVRRRCVVGLCRARNVAVPMLIARVRGGRIFDFVLPVGAQGE